MIEDNKSESVMETRIEGRNAVLEALRAKRSVDKVFILDGSRDGTIQTIIREVKKTDALLNFVKKERLAQLSENGNHQGVVAYVAAYDYGTVDEMLQKARAKNEDPFILLLDGIEDPHNLGAIIRTAYLAGAHGVVIPKHRAVGLTSTVARTSAGALNYITVAKVTNLAKTMEELKKEGLWFVCSDMKGEPIYKLDLKGALGLVVGNEGDGVSKKLREACDFVGTIPMKGEIDSLNASVAAGVMAFEVVRQRMESK